MTVVGGGGGGKSVVHVRYNKYLGRFFSCKRDLKNENNPVWSASIHDNSRTPDIYEKNTCGYCNWRFRSREELFHHLAFMNIDTRPAKNPSPTETKRSTKHQTVPIMKRSIHGCMKRCPKWDTIPNAFLKINGKKKISKPSVVIEEITSEKFNEIMEADLVNLMNRTRI